MLYAAFIIEVALIGRVIPRALQRKGARPVNVHAVEVRKACFINRTNHKKRRILPTAIFENNRLSVVDTNFCRRPSNGNSHSLLWEQRMALHHTISFSFCLHKSILNQNEGREEHISCADAPAVEDISTTKRVSEEQRYVETSLWGDQGVQNKNDVTDYVKKAIDRATDVITMQEIQHRIIKDSVNCEKGHTSKGFKNKRNEERSPTVEVLHVAPALVLIHDFLSHEMCNDLIRSANTKQAYQRSTTTSSAQEETTSLRTSSTTWLRDDDCPVPLRTIATLSSHISGLPPSHQENLQVVRYEKGQRFDIHTDHLDSFNDFECRGRLATCLIYLNDAIPVAGSTVEKTDLKEKKIDMSYSSAQANKEFSGVHSKTTTNTLINKYDNDTATERHHVQMSGGETIFPGLNVTIVPRKGSAIFFWNTKECPGQVGYHPDIYLHVDDKVRHAGLPVISGTKWICNRWIHPIDFGAGVRGL